jgi:hypothetical protein
MIHVYPIHGAGATEWHDHLQSHCATRTSPGHPPQASHGTGHIANQGIGAFPTPATTHSVSMPPSQPSPRPVALPRCGISRGAVNSAAGAGLSGRIGREALGVRVGAHGGWAVWLGSEGWKSRRQSQELGVRVGAHGGWAQQDWAGCGMASRESHPQPQPLARANPADPCRCSPRPAPGPGRRPAAWGSPVPGR